MTELWERMREATDTLELASERWQRSPTTSDEALRLLQAGYFNPDTWNADALRRFADKWEAEAAQEMLGFELMTFLREKFLIHPATVAKELIENFDIRLRVP